MYEGRPGYGCLLDQALIALHHEPDEMQHEDERGFPWSLDSKRKYDHSSISAAGNGSESNRPHRAIAKKADDTQATDNHFMVTSFQPGHRSYDAQKETIHPFCP